MLGDRRGVAGGRRGAATHNVEGTTVSIVRQGLAEDAKFGDGYDAIFGKKDETARLTA